MMSTSVKDLSSQMKSIRSQLSSSTDVRTQLMMDALRGKNLNDDDKQTIGIDMQVVEMKRTSDDDSDVLPTYYDPLLLEAYFSKRPAAVRTRIFQIARASAGYIAGFFRFYFLILKFVPKSCYFISLLLYFQYILFLFILFLIQMFFFIF